MNQMHPLPTNSPLDAANTALSDVLDTLCPMHLYLSETGHVINVGPTLKKMRPKLDFGGKRFLEIFKVDRPRSIETMQDLLARERTKLHLEFRDAPQTSLKGILVRLPEGQGAIVNLSFGISVVEGVRDYDLNNADFAATDLAIEMLYLVEAKSAAMEASRNLNLKLQGAKLAAEKQAVTDTLTGLKNRRAADEILMRMVETDHKFSLMHIDLDYFKAVNDELGHAAGDHVLREVASIMKRQIRGSDTIARVGGDEFMVIFDGLIDPDRLRDVARRLISDLEIPIPFEQEVCKISASIGIAIHQGGTDINVDQLVQDSDRALYASKRNGRGCTTIYDPRIHSDELKPK